MTKSHTPTPWNLSDERYDGKFIVQCNTDIDGLKATVASVGYKPNAAFIVRACNAHEELVAALVEAQQYLHDMLYAGVLKNDGSHNLHVINTTIAQALIKAKGES